MNRILITGAAGMIGRKLTERLTRDGALNGRPIDKLTLLDVISPAKPESYRGKLETVATDLAAPGEAGKAIAGAEIVVLTNAGHVFCAGANLADATDDSCSAFRSWRRNRHGRTHCRPASWRVFGPAGRD